MEARDVAVDVFGKLALFTKPENKIERVTYPVMTPSAARGVLNSIYAKPNEFYYQITRIDVINPIRYFGVMRNELKGKVNRNFDPVFIDTNEKEKGRTQRHCQYIWEPYYRIHAKIIKRDDFNNPEKSIDGILNQFKKRVKKGQCFRQPCLGTSECVAYFDSPDWNKKPCESVNLNIGNMLYDVFDITKNEPLITGGRDSNADKVIKLQFFDAIVKNGIMEVPSHDSPDIRRIRNA